MDLNFPEGGAEKIVKRTFWLAWNACGKPRGMGILQDHPKATEDEVWGNVKIQGDYPVKMDIIEGFANGDYVFGRMMKLRIKYTDNKIEYPYNGPNPEYHDWCGKYPSYDDLFIAAMESLEQEKKVEEIGRN